MFFLLAAEEIGNRFSDTKVFESRSPDKIYKEVKKSFLKDSGERDHSSPQNNQLDITAPKIVAKNLT